MRWSPLTASSIKQIMRALTKKITYVSKIAFYEFTGIKTHVSNRGQ